ncbi:MAG TPA: TM2 domain-containing protein [Candidatus Poseidoniaceae archaeon]|nr:TM2 domain-containing protein [Candidatus Poseidoniaceae archaeon]
MQAQQAVGTVQEQMTSDKDWVVTLVLAIIIGTLGVDRIYSGSILLGVLKLFTLGGLGLWWLIDIIMLVTGSYKDGNGLPIATK